LQVGNPQIDGGNLAAGILGNLVDFKGKRDPRLAASGPDDVLGIPGETDGIDADVDLE
jgi:hypothetical protein